MSINFPTSIDSFVDPVQTDPVANANPALNHATQHSNHNDAIVALETKVGVNNSVVTTSLDYKVSTLTTSLATTNTTVAQNSPAGMVIPYAGSSAPTGYLLCDGSAVSRSTYSTLFAIISTTYGVGNGSTTFNLPDCRGLTPYGFKSTDTNFDTLKTPSVYVGEKTHALTVGELAAHSHNNPMANNVAGGTWWSFTSVTDNGAHGFGGQATQSTGSGTAHNNMPPYIVLNFIIKT